MHLATTLSGRALISAALQGNSETVHNIIGSQYSSRNYAASGLWICELACLEKIFRHCELPYD